VSRPTANDASLRPQLALVVIGTLLVVLLGASSDAQTIPCRGASKHATALQRYVQNIISSSRGSSARVRDIIGVQQMDSTAVTLVTSDSICTAVTHAVDSTMGRAPSASSLIVVQFGNRYAAYNPDIVWNARA
jgi:hypothetical protein